MKFICQDYYRQFWGYLFYNHKPTDVIDPATIERCLKDRAFSPFEASVPANVETPPKVSTIPPKEGWDGDKCLKCGKSFRRGKFFHAKYCKG